MRKVKEDLVRLFEEYKSMFSTVEEGSSSVAAVDVTPNVMEEDSIEAILESRKKKRRKNPVLDANSELDKYLMDDCAPNDPNFDILSWWKENSTKYKILSYMAKDILAIHVSSVASESAFSTGKRVLSQWRSSLSARTVEALLCTQSWLQKPVDLDFLMEYVPDDSSSIEEDLFKKTVSEVLDP